MLIMGEWQLSGLTNIQMSSFNRATLLHANVGEDLVSPCANRRLFQPILPLLIVKHSHIFTA